MAQIPFIVYAELTDWCGCESEKYIVYADSEDEAYQKGCDSGIESEVTEFLEEEDFETELDNAKIVVQEYNQTEHGDITWYAALPL